ncbi:retrovirus-related pol polyprotein from transposon TNT 1-94 [Tanacetum coccineum]
MFSCTSTSVASSSSVRRPESKDTNPKKRVSLNTKSKSTPKDVKKSQSSVRLVSNKNDTMNLNASELNANVLKAKTVNAVNDGSNHVCVSCGKNVFMLSYDKCVARYALSPNSRVKRTLFTSPVVAKSSKLGTTPVVAKSRFSVATPLKATNKVSSASSLTPESRQSRTLSTYMKNKIATSRKWQKWLNTNQVSIGRPRVQLPKSHLVFLRVVRGQELTLKHRLTLRNGCSKHMTENLKLLSNFIEKFMGTFCFGNDNFAAITGYGDYVQGNLTICHVYYVEGLRHNLFLVGQFCDGDLEVAFRSNTCFVWNLEGEDLLTGSRDSNLYTISISKMTASSPVCLMSKATSTKSWLWHKRLSHLNFGTMNNLTKQDLVDGLPTFKYDKDHLCSAYEQGKSKKATFLPNSLCYPTNDRDDLGKMRPKANIEYYATRTPEAQIIPLQNTLDNEDTSSSSSIIVEDHDAPQIVSLSEEPIVNKPTTPDFDNHSDEQVQEDVAELDGNTSMNPFVTLEWTMNHPIKQVIGNPSKPVTIRSRLYTDAEMCMYSLTVSTTEPTNIKEAMLDQSWIESMQDELNQFKRLDVWELVERPTDINVIKVKWLWKNKTDAKNTVLSKEYLKSTRIEHGFKRAFMSLFGQDGDTFTSTMLLHIDQLQKQLDKDEFQEDGSVEAFWTSTLPNTLESKLNSSEKTLLQNMGNVKKSVTERTRHKRLYDRRVNKRHMQKQESKVDLGKALDAGLVVRESSGKEYGKQDTSSRLGNDTNTDDAYIRLIYDEEPMAGVQLNAECNIFVTEQQHTEQPEIINEEVNLCAKVKSHKTRNSNETVDQKSHIQKPGRQIFTRHIFYPNKSSVVYEKTSPRSCLRWKPTGRNLNTIGLRWVPTGKIFTSCTGKVDSEPPHGSNVDISKIHKCKQTLDLSAERNSQSEVAEKDDISETSSSAVHAADTPDQRQQQNTTPSTSTTVAVDTPPLSIQTTIYTTSQAPTVTATENINQAETYEEYAQVNKDKLSTSSVHRRDHPLEQVIGNPSQSIRIRRQLETDGEMCMFALTVSRTEPKNIKEAMVDSVWIEAIHEEIHQFE